jgi:hypothetical protein
MHMQSRDESLEMINAILKESGMPETSKQLIRALYRKQQEIIIALDDTVRSIGYRERHVESRLDELLEKVDPEEAEKRKNQPNCESSAGPRLPGRCLI